VERIEISYHTVCWDDSENDERYLQSYVLLLSLIIVTVLSAIFKVSKKKFGKIYWLVNKLVKQPIFKLSYSKNPVEKSAKIVDR